MLDDPLVIPVTAPTGATVAVALSGAGSTSMSYQCTGRGLNSSTYRHTVDSTHWIDLLVGRQEGKRTRYTARFTERELVSDPMNDNLNSVKTSTVYIVADVGPLGVGTNFSKMLHSIANLTYDSTDGAIWFQDILDGNT